MTLADTLRRLRSLNEPVPRPARLPSEEDIEDAESELGVAFHADFRDYLRKASDVVYGTREPVTLTLPDSHTDLRTVAREAWSVGVPSNWLPVCEDNGDYYCIRPDGRVSFWSHQGSSDESWDCLADWIEQEWIAQ